MAQVVMRMMAISASNNVLRGTQYSRNVVDAHSELQQHGRAGVPQDVRRNIGTQSGKFSRGLPGPPLLGAYRPPSVFDDVGRGGTAPPTKMSQ